MASASAEDLLDHLAGREPRDDDSPQAGAGRVARHALDAARAHLDGRKAATQRTRRAFSGVTGPPSPLQPCRSRRAAPETHLRAGVASLAAASRRSSKSGASRAELRLGGVDRALPGRSAGLFPRARH